MKINFQSDKWRVMSAEQPASHAAGPAHHSSLVTHHSRSGMALVITLIMLSVTLVMAVAFLAVARRERGAVTTATDTATARLAADTALAGAQAQIIANILTTNAGAYNFGLLVSTNFINPFGYVTGAGAANPTNVNYDYYSTAAGPLSSADLMQNIANLWLLPRPPVFITTNTTTGSNTFRFFLDLNRNGQFEANGMVPEVEVQGATLVTNGTVSEVGDPEWIGVLERPDQPHGPNNHFIARFAYFAQAIGNSLDLNYIHNQTVTKAVNSSPTSAATDGYFRNQGVGSWELNLAAFLADLNTNEWDATTAPYAYLQIAQPAAFANTGNAFVDALALLSYRYGFTYSSLATANNYLANTANYPFNIDGYGDGPLQTTFDTNAAQFADNLTTPWAGADNTNRYFSMPADLFDTTKLPPAFTNRLWTAGASPATYDRYTFYRLLGQLGTDSTADDTRLNLNYNNVGAGGNILPGAETNLVQWTPLAFFTNAADRLLRTYTTNWFARDPADFLATYYGYNGYYYVHDGITNDPTGFGLTNVPFLGLTNQIPAFGLTGIPVFIFSNFVYTSAVNRVLQLAANIYDASTNAALDPNNHGHNYPSVFRPLFSKDTNGNVFITGFTNIVPFADGFADYQLAPPIDIAAFAGQSGPILNLATNIYGVPWIVGAKKGLPNFNEFSMENILSVTRRLQLTRTTNSSTPPYTPIITGTNQMYMMSLNSSLGVELWNSYTNYYPGSISIGIYENATLSITNDDLHAVNPLRSAIFSTNIIIPVTTWPGTAPWYAGNPNSASFIFTNFTGPTLTNSVYRSPYATGATVPSGLTAPCFVATNYFYWTPPYALLFETPSPNGFHFPQFGVVLTNRLQCFVLDFTNSLYHVVDYVHFAGPNGSFNVNSNLADGSYAGNNFDNNYSGVWNTNYVPGSVAPAGLTYGILNQLALSKSGATPPGEDGKWQADPEAVPLGGSIGDQVNYYKAFFLPGSKYGNVINPQLSVDAPYAPTRFIVQYVTWQANDPLVHYLANDVDYSFSPNTQTTPLPGVNHYNAGQAFSALTNLNLGSLNDRYLPWGGNPHIEAEGQATPFDTNNFNSAERDPLMTSSDNWDFPTNKYPTVGWLGRVHRGTPWQTVYLKATDILASNNLTAWTSWTGDLNPFDATNSAPVQDAQLFDVFTTAFDPNATRGTLSVNQANLAAWSALFSGVVVPTNLANMFTIIDPVGLNGTNAALWQMVNYTTNGYAGINSTRANASLFPQGVFTHVGDILRTPALSEKSPFLNGLDPTTQINDEMYEWNNQQVIGLLRLGSPRFVLYGYGQTLKPAPNGVVTSSSLLPSGYNPFGLVTNYQVTAESAVRAVVSVHPRVSATSSGFVTNYTTTVESYNVLPAD
jgi:hypothetical protein